MNLDHIIMFAFCFFLVCNLKFSLQHINTNGIPIGFPIGIFVNSDFITGHAKVHGCPSFTTVFGFVSCIHSANETMVFVNKPNSKFPCSCIGYQIDFLPSFTAIGRFGNALLFHVWIRVVGLNGNITHFLCWKRGLPSAFKRTIGLIHLFPGFSAIPGF